MSIPRRNLPLLAVLAFFAPLTIVTSGCIAVAVGAGAAGAVAYVRGELSTTLNSDLERAQEATARGVEQLGFATISDRRDAFNGVLVARTAGDKKVEVKLRKLSDTTTQIAIRVGLFGDEEMSLAVLDKVRANL